MDEQPNAAPQSTDPLQAISAAARQVQAAAAREDFVSFCEYVLRSESSGAAIHLAPLHKTWARLLDEHDRLILYSFTESAKSFLISVGRTLWTLGKNPAARCLILSDTERGAKRILAVISRYIRESEALHQVFPHLVPGDGVWTDTAITIQRTTVAKDHSVFTAGIGTQILGARFDWIVADDALSWSSCRLADSREKLVQFFDAVVLGRATDIARICLIQTPWHSRDLPHVLTARGGWPTYSFSIQDSHGNSTWPDVWPIARIQARRQELGPIESSKQLDCLLLAEGGGGTFLEEWLQQAMKAGENLPAWPRALGAQTHEELRKAGWRFVLGCDPASSLRPDADYSAFTVAAVRPDQSRLLVACEADHLNGPAIVDKIRELCSRYPIERVLVETVGAAEYILDWLKKTGTSRCKLEGWKTSAGQGMSLQWQAERLASELSSTGCWLIPSINGRARDPEVEKLLNECDPEAHTGDRLASWLFCRIAAERVGRRAESGHLTLLGR